MDVIQDVQQYMNDFKWDRDTFGADIKYPLAAAVIYVVVIFALKQVIKDGFVLKPIVVVHNFFLMALSMAMLVGVVVSAYFRAQQEGGFVDALICTTRDPKKIWDGPLGFWIYVFYLSKYYELLDTVLIVVTNKKLITLHVYHHMVMPFITFSWFGWPWLAGAWWCGMVNSLIHSFMYYYYLQASLGNRVWWKKYLTQGQIVQFCTGMAVCIYEAYLTLVAKEPCTGNLYTSLLSTTINLTFILMFWAFFKSTYKKKGKTSKKD